MTTQPPIADFAGEVLPGHDAEILSAEYQGCDQATWAADAELIASALTNKALPAARPTLEPWLSLYAAAEKSVLQNPDITQAIHDEIKQIRQPLQMAVYSYLTVRMGKIANRQHMPKSPGAQQRRRITTRLLAPPDPNLVMDIEAQLTQKKRDALLKHNDAVATMLAWLDANGRFLQSEETFYYLYNNEHRLFDLDTEAWEAFLHTLTGINPGASVFSQLKAGAKTAAANHGESAPVVKFAHYDQNTQVLRVSRYDGVVYVLDGSDIREEANGAGPAIFYDFPTWQSYSAESCDYDYLAHLGRLPNWRVDAEMFSWAFQVWIQSLFFSELCPTRPIMVFLGEKGSGKSMALRVLMKLLFGEMADISGIPDKPDAFAVAAHHYHLYALDNMDTLDTWMRDKLARISTGATDEYRKLYTNKEMGIIRYRCWLAVTARTPDTLRRDDLADRVIILPLERIRDDARGRELDFMLWARRNRNRFWGYLLGRLNEIVAELRAGNMPPSSSLRMADWEALGRVISGISPSHLDLWELLTERIKNEQSNFLAEGEVVIEAIQTWLGSNPLNPNRWVTARELYIESQNLLFGSNKPDSDWPRNVKSFGWRLRNVTDFLKVQFGMDVRENTHLNRVEYRFDHN